MFSRDLGLIAILVSCVSLLVPSYLAGVGIKNQTMSRTGVIPGVRYIYNGGLIVLGIVQIFYMYSLVERYALGQFSLGSYIFIFGCVNTVLGGLVTEARSLTVHIFFAILSFSMSLFGAFLFSLEIVILGNTLAILGVLIGVIAFVGMGYFYFLYKSYVLAAYWGIVLFSFWVLHFYLLN